MNVGEFRVSNTKNEDRADVLRNDNTQRYILNKQGEKDTVEISTKPKKPLSFKAKVQSYFCGKTDSLNTNNSVQSHTDAYDEEYIQKITKNIIMYAAQEKNIYTDDKIERIYSDSQKNVIKEYVRMNLEDFKKDKYKTYDSAGILEKYKLDEFSDEQCEGVIPFIQEKIKLSEALSIADKSEETKNLTLKYVKNGTPFCIAYEKAEQETSPEEKNRVTENEHLTNKPQENQIIPEQGFVESPKTSFAENPKTSPVKNPKTSSYEDIKEVSNELFNLLNYKYDFSESFIPSAKLNRSEILAEFANMLGKQNCDFSEDDIKQIISSYKKQNSDIVANNKISEGDLRYIELYENMFDDVINIIDSSPKKYNETSKEYMLRVKTQYDKKLQSEENAKQKKINGIVFNPADAVQTQEEKIVLTQEEKNELVDKLNKNRPGANLSYDDNMKKIANKWRLSYMGEGNSVRDDKFSRACLQELPKYESKNGEPLARWMHIYDKNELRKYINSIPDEGATYSFDRFQSFAKSNVYAETEFRDDNREMNVKVTVYPKRKTTQAYDMGTGKYGSNEIVYPKNSRFKVVHKGWEEYSDGKRAFPRYCIYLQEE